MRNKVSLLLSNLLLMLLPVSARASDFNPFTGDEFQMSLWIGLRAASLVAVVVLVFLLLRKKK